jgi:hypothetical protein
MGDVIQFPNPKWLRLKPILVQPWEVNCVVVYNFLGWEVPRFQSLTVFEQKWLDHLHGYRHREVYNYLEDDKDRRDREICMKLYGNMPTLENVRWP